MNNAVAVVTASVVVLIAIKDKSLADLDHLPPADELAEDIIENLQSALESFRELRGKLN